MKSAGFTLIELLVAVALALVVLFAASNLLISSSGSATNLQARNELLQEGQIAMNYIATNVREAAYVYPDGTTLNLGGGDTTRRPGGQLAGGRRECTHPGADQGAPARCGHVL
ncbi:prepilin-type N-terminal cleavage/methylation domain-containing protein [Deinococcus multiflagellatus]|uniref:Prepilin-type N-terminal cleavage/methylation domain-containing protein n=1 Tax=Deinococcus multiflagellatus TaxID=1656887 RepID=A0ABW1ZL97_9DEIO